MADLPNRMEGLELQEQAQKAEEPNAAGKIEQKLMAAHENAEQRELRPPREQTLEELLQTALRAAEERARAAEERGRAAEERERATAQEAQERERVLAQEVREAQERERVLAQEVREAQERERVMAQEVREAQERARQEDEKIRFTKGLPVLRANAAAAKSSTKTNTGKHAPVNVVTSEFKVIPESLVDANSKSILRLIAREKQLEYDNESNIEQHVMNWLQDTIVAAGFNTKLGVKSQMTVSKASADLASPETQETARGDIWVISVCQYPIGVIEVKLPHSKGPLEDSAGSLFAQVHTYMASLRDHFGVSPVFGLVTTYNEWRVCWLQDPIQRPASINSGAPLSRAGLEEAAEFYQRIPTLHALAPRLLARAATSLSPPPEHSTSCDPQADLEPHGEAEPASAWVSQDDCLAEPASPWGPGPTRATLNSSSKDSLPPPAAATAPLLPTVFASRIYAFNDPELPVVLTTAIHLMAHAIINPKSLVQYTGRSFIMVSDVATTRVTHGPSCDLSAPLNMETMPVPRKNGIFFIIANLHGGAHGSVWLARTAAGALHVLKFPLKQQAEDATQLQREKLKLELANWVTSYPGLVEKGLVALREFQVSSALVMPRLGHVSERQCTDPLIHRLVRAEIRRLALQGLQHTDLHWRHVGLYHDERVRSSTNLSGLVCVFFDLASFERKRESAAAEAAMLEALDLEPECQECDYVAQ